MEVKLFQVFESLDNPYEITYDAVSARFVEATSYTQEGDEINFYATQMYTEKDVWGVEFTVDGSIGLRGRGNQQQIFATVLQFMKDFIKMKNPSYIVFESAKSPTARDSRSSLYNKLIIKYASSLGYETDKITTDEFSTYFALKRKGLQEGKNDMKGGLGKWFRQDWVDISRTNKDGSHPPCGANTGEAYAKCVPARKAASMTKKEKESAVRRKRRAQRKAGRGRAEQDGGGEKPIRVSTEPES